MYQRTQFFSLTFVGIALVTITQFCTVHSLSCLPCDPASCPDVDCAGGTVLGPCGCCQVCAKQEHEECGGWFEMNGECDRNLTCVIQPSHGDLLTESEFGICKPTHSLTPSDKCHETSYYGCNIVNGVCDCHQQVACSNPFRFQSQVQCKPHESNSESTRKKCEHVRCNVQQSRNCPRDSVLLEGYTRPGECCPTQGHCKCRPDRCVYTLCPTNTQRLLVRSGQDRPGSCCDIYRCIPQRDNGECSGVRCSLLPLHSISCPSDSIAVRNPFPTSKCCAGEPICQCQKIYCPQRKCPGNKESKVAYRGNGKPGSCCDEYTCTEDDVLTGCSVNGTHYEHGSTYRKGHCRSCECKMGVSYCGPISCPNLESCTRVTMNKGDCCPTCLDEDSRGGTGQVSPFEPYPLCTSEDNLHTYAVGETWSPDACTYCTCADGGQTQCTAAFCREPPIVTVTPTCPSLGSCTLTDFDCHYGFQYDEEGCKMCTCKTVVDGCSALAGCALHCPKGYAADESGCSICQCREKKCKDLTTCRKQCPYGYKLNKKGCDRCKCRRCPPMDSCDKECSLGLDENRYGCLICKCRASPASTKLPESLPVGQSCHDELTGGRRDDGETWSSDCNICVCRGGDIMCDVMKCKVPECDKPSFEEGACCATCPGEDESLPLIPQSLSCRERDGDWFVEGDAWTIDQCTSCTCHSGRVLCTSKICPPTPCESPVFDEGLCCPICIVHSGPMPSPTTSSKKCEDSDGIVYENGRIFRSDPCTNCLCNDGEIKCFNEICPQVLSCTSPVLKRGRCCPQCLGESKSFRTCDDNGRVRVYGEQWNKTSPTCTTCACVDGVVDCRSPKCSPIPKKCRRAYRRPGACCDECILEETEAPFVSIPYPEEQKMNLVPLVLGIAAFVLLVIAMIVGVVLLKRKCPLWKANDKYTPGSPSKESDRSQMMVKCSSLRSGSTGTARTVIVSTSSEEEKTFRGDQ